MSGQPLETHSRYKANKHERVSGGLNTERNRAEPAGEDQRGRSCQLAGSTTTPHPYPLGGDCGGGLGEHGNGRV